MIGSKLDTFMYKSLWFKVKELRKEYKYTLEKLAKLTDSNKSYIWEEANITVESATDARFYRKYQQMDEKTKAKIRACLQLFVDDKERR